MSQKSETITKLDRLRNRIVIGDLEIISSQVKK